MFIYACALYLGLCTWVWFGLSSYMNMLKQKFKLNKSVRHTSTNSKGLGLNSPLYNIPISSVEVKAVHAAASQASLCSFINALQKLYRLQLGSSRAVNTIASIIVFYAVFISIHNSKFSEYTVKYNKLLTIPQFIKPLLSQVINKVESRQNQSGWVIGTLTPHNARGAVDFVLAIDKTEYYAILDECMLTRFSNAHYVDEIYKIVQSKLESTGDSEDTLFDFCCNFLKTVELGFYQGDLHMWVESPTKYVSSSYGIYRFNNSYSYNEYNVVSSSCTDLREGTINLYACFLRIFQPEFKDVNGLKFPPTRRSSDTPFNVDGLLIDYWSYYLSGQTFSIPEDQGKELVVKRKRTKPKSKTNSESSAGNEIGTREYSTSNAPSAVSEVSRYHNYNLIFDSNLEGIITEVYAFPKPIRKLFCIKGYSIVDVQRRQ